MKSVNISGTKMTIKTADLLELLTKAGELDFSVFVKKDEDGDYIVKFYELYTNNFDEKIIIDKNNISCGFGRDDHSFDDMMIWFDVLLKKKEEEKLKEQNDKNFFLVYLMRSWSCWVCPIPKVSLISPKCPSNGL
jgi:hypothetical protein